MPSTLSCPAPSRVWEQTPAGGWFSRPYEYNDVLEVFSYGGWFTPGGHDFATAETARLASRRPEGIPVFRLPSTGLDPDLEKMFGDNVKFISV